MKPRRDREHCEPGAGSWFRLELPSDPRALPWVSHGLRGFFRATGWSRRHAFHLELAVNEALDNAMSHGNRLRPGAVVRLEIEDCETGVRIDVVDQGAGFDPASLDPIARRNETLAERGRGVALMRRLMDEIDFQSGPRGTRLRMTKRRPAGRTAHRLPKAS